MVKSYYGAGGARTKVRAKSAKTVKNNGANCAPKTGDNFNPLLLASSTHFEYLCATRTSAPQLAIIRMAPRDSLATAAAWVLACSTFFCIFIQTGVKIEKKMIIKSINEHATKVSCQEYLNAMTKALINKAVNCKNLESLSDTPICNVLAELVMVDAAWPGGNLSKELMV